MEIHMDQYSNIFVLIFRFLVIHLVCRPLSVIPRYDKARNCNFPFFSSAKFGALWEA